MMEQYALTLDLLLQVLHHHQQTYQIQAMIPAETLALKLNVTRGTQCQVSLVAARGAILSCRILDQHAQVLLDGEAAFACVQFCEQIIWSVQVAGGPAIPDLSLPPLSSQDSWASRPPARLERSLSTVSWGGLSRKQRLVLVLLDGKRSVRDLSTLLNLPSEHIEEVLQELARLGLIL